jgi:4a-hydroxytetrahydrobiopterin dehydratase
MELKEKSCVFYGPGSVPLSAEKIKKYKQMLSPGWKLVEDKKIRKEFPFVNFKNGMVFVNEVAELADIENHHPAILIEYSKVEVDLSTHSVGGLTENDFIMAAKIDEL